jgi:hypothetical protein
VLREEIQAKAETENNVITFGEAIIHKYIRLLLNLLELIRKRNYARNYSTKAAGREIVNLEKPDPIAGTGYRPKVDRR